MIKLFNLIFSLRNVKKTKLKVSFKNFLLILRYYIKKKLYKYIEFQIFYYIILDNSLKNLHTFESALISVHKEILEKEINK
jgi:hypothetical protein